MLFLRPPTHTCTVQDRTPPEASVKLARAGPASCACTRSPLTAAGSVAPLAIACGHASILSTHRPLSSGRALLCLAHRRVGPSTGRRVALAQRSRYVSSICSPRSSPVRYVRPSDEECTLTGCNAEAARPRLHDDDAADAGRARRALPSASDRASHARAPCPPPPPHAQTADRGALHVSTCSCLSAPCSSARVRCACRIGPSGRARSERCFGDGASAAAARKGIARGRARDTGARRRARASAREGAGRSRSPRAVLHFLLFGGCRGRVRSPAGTEAGAAGACPLSG